MKTMIDLPEEILERTKIAAANRRAIIENLVIQGLETILKEENSAPLPPGALARLRAGYHLGGKPLSREATHAR